MNTLKVLTFNFAFLTLGSNLENKSNLSKFYEKMPLRNSIQIEGIKNFKENLVLWFGTWRYWHFTNNFFVCGRKIPTQKTSSNFVSSKWHKCFVAHKTVKTNSILFKIDSNLKWKFGWNSQTHNKLKRRMIYMTYGRKIESRLFR